MDVVPLPEAISDFPSTKRGSSAARARSFDRDARRRKQRSGRVPTDIHRGRVQSTAQHATGFHYGFGSEHRAVKSMASDAIPSSNDSCR